MPVHSGTIGHTSQCTMLCWMQPSGFGPSQDYVRDHPLCRASMTYPSGTHDDRKQNYFISKHDRSTTVPHTIVAQISPTPAPAWDLLLPPTAAPIEPQASPAMAVHPLARSPRCPATPPAALAGLPRPSWKTRVVPARQATRKLGAAPQRTSGLGWGPAARKQGATKKWAAISEERDTSQEGASLHTQLGAGSKRKRADVNRRTEEARPKQGWRNRPA